VSVEAISWALNLASVPADRGGQPSSTCKFVLVGLANHAGPDGTGAFPSVATLVRYTSLSERTVRTWLDRLESEGIIRPCDPDIVAARIKRADRRSPRLGPGPQPGSAATWTSPARPLRVVSPPSAGRARLHQAGPSGRPRRTGCNPRTPPGPWITRCNGCTPQPGRGATSAPTGCNPRGHGVRPCPRCKPAATASRASPATPLACARTGSNAPPLHCGDRV